MWQGQAGQDHTIASLFTGRKGYFVDLAANLPVHHSNTRALERDFGWQGLCIEPNPHLMLALAEQRSCTVVNALASQTGLQVQWRESIQKHWGSSIVSDAKRSDDATVNTILRETVSLADLLDANRAPRQISYLSLDVEGAEEQVLGEGFNFSRYTFLSMTIERPPAALKRRLLRVGYTYILEHGHHGDELWVHEDIPGGAGRAKTVAQACWRRWMAAHNSSWGYTRRGTLESKLVAAEGQNPEAVCWHGQLPLPLTWPNEAL